MTPMRAYRVFGWAITLGLLVSAANACDVPVFRYALERWDADPYVVRLLHTEPLNETEQAAWESLADESAANLIAHGQDSESRPDPGLDALRAEEGNTDTPWIALYYPPTAPRKSYVWAGPLTETNCKTLFDSPARRKIAHELLNGHSSVFVLVESGDVAADNATAESLDRELLASQAALKLPGRTDDNVPDIDETKVRIEFTTVRVSRRDPDERIFIEMLLASEPGLRDIDAPMVFPVYGRGRVLYALAGKGINAKTIRNACAFVTGPCSCQIKDENPGVDLLIAMDWDTEISEFLLKNPEPAVMPSPALMQSSAPDEPTTKVEMDGPADAAPGPVSQARDSAAEDDKVNQGLSPLTTAAVAMLIVVVAVVAGSIVLSRRRGEDAS
jgi:hypothetical protein